MKQSNIFNSYSIDRVSAEQQYTSLKYQHFYLHSAYLFTPSTSQEVVLVIQTLPSFVITADTLIHPGAVYQG